ncbi:hypothetical protein A2Z33_01650 [Candidatus Gottesmanbacteria bacterium RBG_16_52_11]|uniref:Hydrogenase/sulfur reductase subunit alpha n=1 Tax=Candidatus Gottesmanbacteria bacterium RBG_16_52_11 TaxID=1798374 RepID=A0A1F5YPD7_9BACT|nr:MAG: hypothetical protein A2Z33_01650 [Candidatus Gottesmanbacteria bacterium RBG_16_52_11]
MSFKFKIMHTTDIDISLEEITKIEGAASCDIKVRNGEVTECRFAITEMRRFYEEAIRGKAAAAVPGIVARVCGTCSNAHLLASVKAVESAMGIPVSPNVSRLRELLNYGLIIRDHGLHLYIFALPDLFGKESLLAFDENEPSEHQFLHDCFDVKEAGNRLGIAVGGRSVHAPFVRLGGFSKFPTENELIALIPKLREARPMILRLLEVFAARSPVLGHDINTLALEGLTFLNGDLTPSAGSRIAPSEYRKRVTPRDIPHSQATGYLLDGKPVMVGALARLNANRSALHPKTRADASSYLARFPSRNIFDNNIAQAIEMLHAIDNSIGIIESYRAEPATGTPKTAAGTGYGIIEAPRGTLYHEIETAADGTVIRGTIIVPTGLNQIGIEMAIRDYVNTHLGDTKDSLSLGIETVVRAYDPCMSCATHFLKLRIDR